MSPPLPAAKLTHIWPTPTRWMTIGLVYCTWVLRFINRVNISITAKYIMPKYGLSEM